MMAAMMGPSDESGPSTRYGDGPKTAYAMRHIDGRVQARDGRQSGQLGIGHALRHEQRREHHGRHDVAAQPAPLVRPDGAEARDPGLQAAPREGPWTAVHDV